MKHFLLLALGFCLFISCGDSRKAEPVAVAGPTEHELKEAYHGILLEMGVFTDSGEQEQIRRRDEADAQILEINPDFFSMKGLPEDIDAVITERVTKLSQMISNEIPLPQVLNVLLKKAKEGALDEAEKVLLARSLGDIIDHLESGSGGDTR